MITVFEDLQLIDVNQVKEILARVDRKNLTMALKGTTDQLKDHFFATMSAGQPTKESTTKRSPFDAEMALREVPRSMPTWRMSAIFKSLLSHIS